MQQYLDLLKHIKENGEYKSPARDNMPSTKSIFGYQMRFDLAKGFPIVTTKKVSFKNIATELLSFLRGDLDIKYLNDNNVNIWNQDVEKYDPVDKINFGKMYGHQWRNFGGKPKKIKRDFEKVNIKINDLINVKDNEEIGKIYSTLSYGDFKVIDVFKVVYEKHYKIQFLKTGFIRKIRASRIKLDLYDPYYPSFCGVACLGIPENSLLKKELIEKFKIVWKGIIQRCYDENKDNYQYYGEIGVKVCERWKCFEFFLLDIQKIKGFENKIKDWSNYELDKDIVGNGFEYSFNNCIWTTKSENALKSKEKYIYTVSDGQDIFNFKNTEEFLRDKNISSGNFNSMLRGERRVANGYYLIDKKEIKEGIDQISELIKNLKNNPEGRRHLITSWNPLDIYYNEMCLHPCHALAQFNCRLLSNQERCDYLRDTNPDIVGTRRGMFLEEWLDSVNAPKYKLDCHLYQRSADVFLGVPYNISSYALLTHILAKICNMQVGELVHTFGDVHIYDNHENQVDEQLQRDPMKLPELLFSDKFHFGVDILNGKENYSGNNTIDFDTFIKELSYTDFKLENYQHHPEIKAPLSTGLK